MAWGTPKTDWEQAAVVGEGDLNRIESNLLELHNRRYHAARCGGQLSWSWSTTEEELQHIWIAIPDGHHLRLDRLSWYFSSSNVGIRVEIPGAANPQYDNTNFRGDVEPFHILSGSPASGVWEAQVEVTAVRQSGSLVSFLPDDSWSITFSVVPA